MRIMRPVSYQHVARLSREGQCCLDHARILWRGLSDAQRMAIADASECHGGRKICAPRATEHALAKRGITMTDRPWRLTALGMLVRECGWLPVECEG